MGREPLDGNLDFGGDRTRSRGELLTALALAGLGALLLLLFAG